jgi:hypothetical protein
VYDRPFYFYLYILNTRFKKENYNPEGNFLSSNFEGISQKNSTNIEESKLIDLKGFEDFKFSLCLNFDEIIGKDLNIKGFHSNIIIYKSIYNNEKQITEDDIYKYSKELGRVNFYEHYFIWFGEYFNNYMSKIRKLMNEDGFICKQWRYYIALMAVSTMKSKPLFKILEEKFLENGGDESWLIYGLDVIPEKLSKLSKINNILAHQPWIINTDDIKVILLTISICIGIEQ